MSMTFNNHATITIERMPLSSAMRQALAAHILKQKQKKREEEEQDAAFHRELQKREIKRQQDNESLEQTNEQIKQLEEKLEQLKKEKHDLFARLKKVLNFEEEQRRRVQQLQFQHAKEASEVLAKVGTQASHLIVPGASPPMTTNSGASTPKPLSSSSATPLTASTSSNQQQTPQPTAKRPRSPSPAAKAPTNENPIPVIGQHTRHLSQNSSSNMVGFMSPKQASNVFSQRMPFNQQIPPPILSPRSCLINIGTDGRMNQSVGQMTPVSLPPHPAHPIVRPVVLPPSAQPTRLPAELRTFNPTFNRSPYDIRPVAPQATHLPARIPQHVSPMSIPVLPPQQRPVGSITTGYPLQRGPPHQFLQAGLMAPQLRPLPRGNFPRRPYPYPPYHHPRL